MRSFAAIAIVCLLLSAWIGGFRRCGEATHQLRLLHRMNARDAAVARQLEERLAGNRLIKVVDEAHVERRGHFYSNDALFSLDVEGETVHFFVIHESKTLDYETEYEAAPPASRDERPLVNLNDFFKIYFYHPSIFSALMNASCGMSILPKERTLVLPAATLTPPRPRGGPLAGRGPRCPRRGLPSAGRKR